AAKLEAVKTDEEGRFVLKKLPEGEATLWVARGREFARLTAKAGEGNEMRLTPSSVFIAPMRRQFFEQFVKDVGREMAVYWEALGSEKVLAIGLQKDGALPPGEMDVSKADWTKAGAAMM